MIFPYKRREHGHAGASRLQSTTPEPDIFLERSGKPQHMPVKATTGIPGTLNHLKPEP